MTNSEKNEASQDEVSSSVRRLLLFMVLACLAGVAVSVELTRIHVLVHTDPTFHSVCAVSEGVNCETVASSPYSVFAGIPVSVWGIFGYALIGVRALAGLRGKDSAPKTIASLFLLSLFSVATSAVLAVISQTRIQSLCLFCTASYVVSAVLLLLAVLAWRRTRSSFAALFAAEMCALGEKPKGTLAWVVVPGTLLMGLYAYLPTYWSSPGWDDLPKLPTGTDERGHYWIGAREPKLTVVEFSDYQCPHCRAAHKAIRAMVAKYPDIRFIHRHFPLDMACNPKLRRPFHRRACLFAEAAECAGRQGQFWAMNDALYSVQDRQKSVDVDPMQLAVRLGLNRVEFKQCLESHQTAARVATDLSDGESHRITGTPTYVVKDRLFVGRISEKQLEELLGS